MTTAFKEALPGTRWTRKASDWADAIRITDPKMIEAAYGLPRIQITTTHPCATFPIAVPQYFVGLLPDGRRILVDTQHADGATDAYARYIAALPDAPETMSSVSAATIREEEMREADYRRALKALITEAEGYLARPTTTHAGHNLGNRAHELSVLAAKVECASAVTRFLKGGGK